MFEQLKRGCSQAAVPHENNQNSMRRGRTGSLHEADAGHPCRMQQNALGEKRSLCRPGCGRQGFAVCESVSARQGMGSRGGQV